MTKLPRPSKTPPLTRDGEPRAFFGRRSGKTLPRGQQRLFDDLLPTLRIALPQAGALDPASLFPDPLDDFVLEIGYGGGEHLARQLAESPRTGFIGCEVFTGGIGKFLERVDAGRHRNVRLFDDDALKLLLALPDASIAGVYLLYPDPWPKARHHKRRFVSPMTLAELGRVIREDGFLRVATDIEDYANWTLAHVLRSPDFTWPPAAPGSWHQPFAGWEATRYEQKARREGRSRSFYFTFRRRPRAAKRAEP